MQVCALELTSSDREGTAGNKSTEAVDGSGPAASCRSCRCRPGKSCPSEMPDQGQEILQLFSIAILTVATHVVAIIAVPFQKRRETCRRHP